jgi:two-component system chemotaxis response regulator CheB
VQHLHPDFITGFAAWIGRATGADVALADHGVVPQPGCVYLAPAGTHLMVAPGGTLLLDPDPVTLHRPSANQLFLSMAASLGPAAVGVLLTGMGDDGAAGLLAIRQAGGTTIVQDGASSIIDGMPRAARDLGAATVVAPLSGVARAIRAAVKVPVGEPSRPHVGGGRAG